MGVRNLIRESNKEFHDQIKIVPESRILELTLHTKSLKNDLKILVLISRLSKIVILYMLY